MKLLELLVESKGAKTVVVYGGRFQPFHKGHYAAYKWLCHKFGKENVWLASSNKTNTDPAAGDISPFTFKEKKEIMVGLYGISARRIVQCDNPTFKPIEIFKLYHGYDITYISAVGSKDEGRYVGGDFFKPLPDKERDWETLEDKVGYYTIIPMAKKISGTQVREALTKAISADEADLEDVYHKFFGHYDSTIAQLITAKLKDIK